jgi:hypothetical protein
VCWTTEIFKYKSACSNKFTLVHIVTHFLDKDNTELSLNCFSIILWWILVYKQHNQISHHQTRRETQLRLQWPSLQATWIKFPITKHNKRHSWDCNDTCCLSASIFGFPFFIHVSHYLPCEWPEGLNLPRLRILATNQLQPRWTYLT